MSPEHGPGPQVAHPEANEAAAEAARALVAALRVADAPLEDLARATALVQEAVDLLVPHRVDAVVMQSALRPAAMALDGPGREGPAGWFPYSPVVGPLNPLAPPIVMDFDGGRVRATTELDATYSGPPDMVHGGVIALIFDDLFNVTNLRNGVGAFTGTLSVRYEAPTPVRAELELEGWVESIEGRKVRTCGTIRHAGGVTARAEGVFIEAGEGSLDLGT